MAATLAAVASTNGAAGAGVSFAMPLPTGTAAGELLVISIAIRTINAQTYTVSGAAANVVEQFAAGSSRNAQLWHVVTAANVTAGTVTVGWTTSVRYIIGSYRIIGANTTTPVYAAAGFAGDATADTINQVAGGLLIYSVSNHINTAYTWSGGLLEQHDLQNGASGASALTGAGATLEVTTTGTSAAVNYVNTAGGNHNVIFSCINPSAGGTPPPATVIPKRMVGKFVF